jgi:hypothetical protein
MYVLNNLRIEPGDLDRSSSVCYTKNLGRIKKYPKIEYDYESADYENLYFAGTVAHSLDFRKSSGGFIHGFRYTSDPTFSRSNFDHFVYFY